MRATRAYLAGFGTAGSLLAGAALLFVLASAVVSFKGWPHVTDEGQAVSIVQPVAAPHRASVQRIEYVAEADAAAIRRQDAQPASSDQVPGKRAAQVTTLLPTAETTVNPHGLKGHAAPVNTTPTTGTTGCRGASCTATPAPTTPTAPTVGGVVSTATSTVGNVVTTAGSAIGSIVKGVTGTVGSKLPGAVGGTVTTTGAALGSTVSATTSSLGKVVSSLGATPGTSVTTP